MINTVLSSSPYAVSSSAFCKPSLVGTYIRTLFVPKRLFRIKIKLEVKSFKVGFTLRAGCSEFQSLNVLK